MAAVVGQFSQHLEIYPVHRTRPAAMTRYDGIEWHVGCHRSSSCAGLSVRRDDTDDGVVVVDNEGLRRSANQAELNPGPTPDAFLEPHPLHPCHMFEQSEKRCGRWDQPFTRLLLGETVDYRVQGVPVLLDERLELSAVIVQQNLESTRHWFSSIRLSALTRARVSDAGTQRS